MKSLSALVTTLKSRIFAFATMEDRSFFNILSPALQSLRLVDGFVRNVFVLMSGATVAMIVPVIAAPILTRLYSPADYGILALYVSIVTVVSAPITANYDGAVMLPEKDGDALNLVAVCLVIALFFSSVLFFASWFFNRQFTALLGNSHIAMYLTLAPIMAFMMGLHGTLMYWFNRKKQFRRLAVNKIAESVVTPLASIGLGISSWGATGLIASLMGGKAAAALTLIPGIWRDKEKSGIRLERKVMTEQAIRYSDFPLYAAPASLLDIVSLQVPVLLLTKFFGPSVVGLFALTTRVIGAPLALVSQCVAQVYYQWTTEARQRNDGASYVLKIAGYLALLASGPTVAIILFSPALFSFVFGKQWAIAGDYARILIFPLAVKFVVSPLTVIMPATGNIRLGSVWKATYFVSTWVVLYIASHFQVKTFLYIFSAHESVLYAYYFVLVMRASASVGAAADRSVGAV